jgi:von Willebrand factor type A domain
VSAKVTRCALAGLVGLLAAPAAALAQAPAGEAGDRGSVELILDASGSMQTRDAGGGQTRIDAAREALDTLIGELPPGAPVGLRVYGDAQTDAEKRRSCNTTRLVQPIAPLDPDGLRSRLDDFDPGGQTPIGNALMDAGADLRGTSGQVIVLVSDGLDTCAPPDPCRVAARLADSGIDVRIQAIGFKVDARATRLLRCIARVSGGVYRDADDAESLAQSLIAATLRALRGYRVAGEPVTGGTAASDPAVIGEGQFVDGIEPGEALWYAVDVPAGTGMVSSATLVPPLPRIPIGVASLGGDLGMALYGPVSAGSAEPGATTSDEPDGAQVASDSQFGLLRELAAGVPVTTTTGTEGTEPADGRFVFGVALEDTVDPLPPREYPLELLVDQVGTPIAEEEDEPADDAAEEDEDEGPSAPAVAGLALGGLVVGFALVSVIRRRRG